MTAEQTWLRGDWMQTYSGARFYPRDPQPDEINAVDIAHALSLLCRYGGHVDRFYSVAEHCVLMSRVVAPEHALAALLHDATEAYVVDVPRPLKLVLPGYSEIEGAVWMAIVEAFNLDVTLPVDVHDADNRILIDEKRALLPRSERWPIENLPALGVTIEGWAPEVAERRYLERLVELVPDLTDELVDVVDLTPEPEESPLLEAHRLVHGDRQGSYGHPIEDFTRTGRLWGGVLAGWARDPDQPVPPELVALCMVMVKASREVNAPKRDNRVDGAGYFETLDLVRRAQDEALVAGGKR